MSAALPKKDQQPLVCFFRLYGDDKRDMLSVSGTRRGAHNAIALAGTMAEIRRLQAKASSIPPAVLKAVTDAQRLGVDVPAVLKQAARGQLQ